LTTQHRGRTTSGWVEQNDVNVVMVLVIGLLFSPVLYVRRFIRHPPGLT
jgi:hypothetical protein